MALDVSCQVSNCVYNEKTKCNANEISVCNSDCHSAKLEKQTQCDTFKCKK